ncbi:SANT/Myb_domain [Hexamita inflata]|uniref:SANT/Myb domain n=1 Tax=Hexamita inflata TaxID=28002 RepID=A0AA86QJC0_9EUKA|nr:SANT/Myb domain [Hexamita inflata]
MQEGKKTYNKWTKAEIKLFEQLYDIHYKDFKMYVEHFKNRTEQQIKSFYYNVLQKIKAEEKRKILLTQPTIVTEFPDQNALFKEQPVQQIQVNFNQAENLNQENSDITYQRFDEE